MIRDALSCASLRMRSRFRLFTSAPHHHARRVTRSLENNMADTATKQTIYSIFWLYRADPAYQQLSAGERRAAQASFLAALEGRDRGITLRGAYSLVGLRADADLLLWAWGADLDAIQRLAVALRQSGLGRY